MKFTTLGSPRIALVLCLSSLLAVAHAFPASVSLNERDVYVPEIQSPQEGDVWHIGESYDVTWCVQI